ncbi:MAG: porin [Paramuribaculum sp.]|nr:porin [Paramuribaculum sp.]
MSFKRIISAMVVLYATAAAALQPMEPVDTFLIPERAVVVSGDHLQGRDLVAILYDTSDIHFNDPSSPRFLFLDREGKVALGIGGYIKGSVYYDFNGENTDGPLFTPYLNHVPNSSEHRQRLGGTANHSTIFLQLAGRSSRFGYYEAYIQTNFSADGNNGYGLKLKQAYVTLGNITAGLAPSTWSDASAGTPTVDDQGPAGESSTKNILVRYRTTFGNRWSLGVGVEIPQVSSTFGFGTAKIGQRVPDIPFNIQYSWGKNSHLRVAGLLRTMTYRDALSEQNKFRFGWAAQVSGTINLGYGFNTYFQGACGQGYGRYINDLSGNGYDLIQSSTPGKMIAPKTLNYEVGVKYAPVSKFFIAAAYSQVRVYDQSALGNDAYRQGQYATVSAFCDPIRDLRVGVGYMYGVRKNYDGQSGCSNRLEAMIQYSF